MHDWNEAVRSLNVGLPDDIARLKAAGYYQEAIARRLMKTDNVAYINAVLFGPLFLILQQLENNLIYPRVVGTSIGLPGMWVLVAVTIGGELMGVFGMLLMIPLASVLYTLAREFTDKRLSQRNIPEEKLQDHPPELQSRFKQNRERKKRRRLQKMKEQFLKMQKEKEDQ